MLVWVLLVLSCASVWGYPEKGLDKKHPEHSEHPNKSLLINQKELLVRKNEKLKEKPGECKLTCSASLSPKVDSHSKTAQVTQKANKPKAPHAEKAHLFKKDSEEQKTGKEPPTDNFKLIDQLQEEIKAAEASVAEKAAAVLHQQEVVNAAMQFAELATAQVSAL